MLKGSNDRLSITFSDIPLFVRLINQIAFVLSAFLLKLTRYFSMHWRTTYNPQAPIWSASSIIHGRLMSLAKVQHMEKFSEDTVTCKKFTITLSRLGGVGGKFGDNRYIISTQ